MTVDGGCKRLPEDSPHGCHISVGCNFNLNSTCQGTDVWRILQSTSADTQLTFTTENTAIFVSATDMR